MRFRKLLYEYFALTALFVLLCVVGQANALPEGFVYLEEVIPNIKVDLRYYTANNFVGERIEGYLEPRCILTKEAAEALTKVQEDLKPFGLGLKIYDAYRPQQAVNHFVRWAKDLQDTTMRSKFYPDVEKRDLFLQGYIAEKSSHTRGSTVDLTIVSMTSEGIARDLYMGTGFDFFSPKSRPDNLSMAPAQRAQRLLLQTLMKKHGFNPYPQEWWHFTLKNEPYPDTYFDFPVR